MLEKENASLKDTVSQLKKSHINVGQEISDLTKELCDAKKMVYSNHAPSFFIYHKFLFFSCKIIRKACTKSKDIISVQKKQRRRRMRLL